MDDILGVAVIQLQGCKCGAQKRAVVGIEKERFRGDDVRRAQGLPPRETYFRDEIFEILRVYRQAEGQRMAAEEEGLWPDDGISHPPLKDVRRVHVHLTDIGRLPPRIVYDPDHE